MNHIDGNKDNNHVSNLQWIEARANSRRYHRNNRNHAFVSLPHKEAHPFAKLTQKKAEKIRDLLAEGIPQTKVAKQFGVAQTTISKVGRGLIWA